MQLKQHRNLLRDIQVAHVVVTHVASRCNLQCNNDTKLVAGICLASFQVHQKRVLLQKPFQTCFFYNLVTQHSKWTDANIQINWLYVASLSLEWLCPVLNSSSPKFS